MEEIEILEDLFLLNYINNTSRSRRGNRELFKSRDEHGFYKTGVNIIINKNPELFLKSTRLNYNQFKALLSLIEPWLQKCSYRKPIGAEQRLYITLYFLAHGCSLHSLSMHFRVGLETARCVVLETCNVLWTKLGSLYVSPPNCAEWETISNLFYESTGLPNCIGAINGKHIRVNSPHNSGSQFFNYKKFHSIVLLAVCDSNYSFTLVDVGAYGNQSDGGVFRNSSFGRKFLNNELDIPCETCLPGSTRKFPYYMVGDAAFPLRENLMKPYAKVTDSAAENFNRRISRARIRIEIAFGILTAQWRILRTSLCYTPNNSKKIVLTTVVLHNYLRLNSCSSQTISTSDTESSILRSISREDLNTSNASAQNALQNRNDLCLYLKLQPQFTTNSTSTPTAVITKSETTASITANNTTSSQPTQQQNAEYKNLAPISPKKPITLPSQSTSAVNMNYLKKRNAPAPPAVEIPTLKHVHTPFTSRPTAF